MSSSALEDEIPLFGLEPFVMKVSSIERTFIDKVFAICDYYLSGGSTERQSRHVYDLYKMMDHVDLNDPLAELFETVRVQRKGLYGCLSAEDGADVAGILRAIVESDAYRLDYKRVTSPLLYENVSYETAIEALPAIAGFLSRRGAHR